jgi:hypothetical protein
MYYLRGFDREVRKIARLCNYSGPTNDDLVGLKAAYNAFLSRQQPHWTTTSGTSIEYMSDFADATRLATLYTRGPNTREKALVQVAVPPHDLAKRRWQVETMKAAVMQIQTRKPKLGQLLELVVNRIFFMESGIKSGGSSSRALGIIWANPPTSWTIDDHIEFLIHELAQNLLFIEEQLSGMLTNYGKIDWADLELSRALLSLPCRLDLLVHDLMLDLELLLARQDGLGDRTFSNAHGASGLLLDACRDRLALIQTVPEWFRIIGPTGLELLGVAAAICETLSLSAAA